MRAAKRDERRGPGPGSIGRFISSDPAKAGTNWYAYCLNNPLHGADPTGLQANGWAIVGGITVGVAVTILSGNPVLGVAAGFGTAALITLVSGGGLGDAVENGCYAGLGTAAGSLLPEACRRAAWVDNAEVWASAAIQYCADKR